MRCFIMELKSIHGTRVSNDNGLASVHYTNASHDSLQYAAPREGEYIRSVAVQAETIEEALKLAKEAI